MIVGFVINSFNGFEDAAVDFIRKVCILESPDIAENIVMAGTGVNIYSEGITLADLQGQPFDCTPIEVTDGEFLIVSNVNYNLEITYNDNLVRLIPTEFIRVTSYGISQFSEYISQRLLKVIPNMDPKSNWTLSEGIWDDNGIWVDSTNWND